MEHLSTLRGERQVSFVVGTPGYGAPATAVFAYEERYRRTRQGWLRSGYRYEYRVRGTLARRAHHDHDPQGVHQHCREARRPERHRHYEDIPRLLEPTHEEFVRQHARAEEIHCAARQPLRIARPRMRN